MRYKVHGYFEVVETRDKAAVDRRTLEAKYAAMFERRAHRAVLPPTLFGMPRICLLFSLGGSRENLDKPINETRDLGYMLYDLDFDRDPHSPSPLFFRAYMDNGVIITDRRQVEVRG